MNTRLITLGLCAVALILFVASAFTDYTSSTVSNAAIKSSISAGFWKEEMNTRSISEEGRALLASDDSTDGPFDQTMTNTACDVTGQTFDSNAHEQCYKHRCHAKLAIWSTAATGAFITFCIAAARWAALNANRKRAVAFTSAMNAQPWLTATFVVVCFVLITFTIVQIVKDKGSSTDTGNYAKKPSNYHCWADYGYKLDVFPGSSTKAEAGFWIICISVAIWAVGLVLIQMDVMKPSGASSLNFSLLD